MTKPVLQDDLFSEFQKSDLRIDRLEYALRPMAIRYIGRSGSPGFINSWVNFDTVSFATELPTGRPAGFYRHLGHVYLVGVIKSGLVTKAAFVLPDGFRPLVDTGRERAFTAQCSGGVGQLAVFADGGVVPTGIGASNPSTFCYLDGVVFRHA